MAAILPCPTLDAIWASYEAAQDSGFRPHLGYSGIGGPCERQIWYSFRWSTRARHAGRILRLFQTGNLAEARFVADLRRIGVTVLDVDPENGRQWKFVGPTGHDGGSMDGVAIDIPEAPKTWHAVELKTHSAKSFGELQRKGVQQSKPTHYAQMQCYMHVAELTRALYLAVNKDNDDLYVERIHYDRVAAERLMAKARRIVFATEAPARFTDNQDAWQCRYCDHRAVCWEGQMPECHCRSCKHAVPIEGGEWHCALHGVGLDFEAQKLGCNGHEFLPDFIGGQS